jgi:flavin reductase (DIM6/NTAB) family NADH-FMN oxidoreductase RutF
MNKVMLGPTTMVYPQPTLLIGANVDGKPNFLAVAWAGVANGMPPMISAALRHNRHTLKGIRQNMTYSANVPSVDMVKEVDYCGVVSGSKGDKVGVCRFKLFYGKLGAPLIEQCPVNMECTVLHIIDLGSHSLVVGRIEETYVSEDCLKDREPDAGKIKPLIYTTGKGGEYRALGRFIGKAFNVGKELFGDMEADMSYAEALD